MTPANLPGSLRDAGKLAAPLGSSVGFSAQTDTERRTLSKPDVAAGLAWSKQPKAEGEAAKGNNLFQKKLGTREGRRLLGTSPRELMVLNGLRGLLPGGWCAVLSSGQGRNPAQSSRR